MIQTPDPLSPHGFPFSIDIEVRFRDLDAMGHVNSAVYLTYFEIARTHFFAELGFGAQRGARPTDMFPFVVLDVTCRYLAPLFLGQTVRVRSRVGEIGTKSFRIDYLLERVEDQVAVAHGSTTLVSFDHDTQKSVPIPDELRPLLARHASGAQ